MDESRIWAAEEQLWTGDADTYRDRIADACLMVVPADPFILEGAEAADAMAQTPRWSEVQLDQRRLGKPRKGTIVLAYQATARRDGAADYRAHCTTTWRRFAKGDWRVVQHQQTPQITLPAG